ncbi:MAG: enoyl-CoA hydratase/isomerase family protein [Trebonia sp.]
MVGETSGLVRVAPTDAPHIARIVIDRAERGNAFTVSMCAELSSALSELEANDDVKVIVIDPVGPDLSVGLDPAEAGSYHENVPGMPSERIVSLRARLRAAGEVFWGRQGLYDRLLNCSKVTVLSAPGRCLDIGLYLVLYCDIAIADESSEFGSPRWQHVGVDGDVSMLLATVGRKRANELMFAGARWSSAQALSAGLVTGVVPDGKSGGAALDIAHTVATIMRDGIAAEKFLTFASTEKMGIGAGFATATYMSAMSSAIHFRPGEFNFLRARRLFGVEEAVRQAEQAKNIDKESLWEFSTVSRYSTSVPPWPRLTPRC